MARSASRRQVFDTVRRTSPTSLKRLVEEVPLSRVTIAAIVRDMARAGLVQEAGRAASTGGRPPALIRYCPDAWHAIGVNVLDHEVMAVLTDLDGRILARRVLSWDGYTSEDMLRAVVDSARTLEGDTRRERVLAIGVGLPGTIDLENGTIKCCTSMGWYDAPIEARRVVETALGLPTYVANRSRIAALGELHAGVGQDVSSLLYVYLGHGIVAGIVLADEVYSGASSNAGELGHSSLVADGPLCKCGNQGCVELYTSEPAIVALGAAKVRSYPNSLLRQATGGNPQGLTLEAIIQCARRGDTAANEVFAEAGMYLGMALSQALNVLDPAMLVLGGPVGCRAGSLLLEPTARELRRRMAPMMLDTLRVVSGSPETDCTAIGAAMLAIKQTPIERIIGGTN